ncbi:glycosyltransferase [Candidatus Acetothermia bacterium]|jgi:spore maturation protein CgeB|nr:glycosyltransferase [Candidatus Acetothermia bacterium]
MKVLVAGDKNIADVVGLLAKAFRACGHEADVFYFNAGVSRIEQARFGSQQLKKIGSCVLNTVFSRSWKDRYFRLINTRFLNHVTEFRPDFLLVVCGVQLFHETLIQLKKRLSIPMVNWVIDDPARAQDPGFLGTYLLYNVLFSCGPEWLDFAKLWSCRIEYLPLATDSDVYRPLEDEQKGKIMSTSSYDTDIVFVGTFSPRDPSSMFRASVLGALANHGYNIKIYGRGVTHYTKLVPGLRTCSVSEGHLPAEEINKIYNRAKIVLNIYNIFNQHVVALRVFEVASAGSFQLTAYQRALDQLFPSGMIETYRNLVELLDKIDFYLRNPDERRRKAEAAATFSREHHSYIRRVDQILGAVFPNGV